MVTIADVADAAGVSISTVSYVMSGKRTISPATKSRVESAIRSLGYSPHAGARALASRATNVIGLQAPLRTGVDVHVVMEVVTGVVTGARKHGYDVLLLTSDDTSGLERAAGGSMVDALIAMDIESDDPRLATLGGLRQPSALIGLPSSPGGIPCVDLDFEAAGRLAVSHLADRGHRRIALIGSPQEVMERHTSYADRLVRGFNDGCAEIGVQGSVHPCPATPTAAGTVDDLFNDAAAPTALVIHNEQALPHLLARLAERGQRVGRDVEVVALCPADVARSLRAAVDVIDIPAAELGTAAADVVCAMLAGESPEPVRLIPPRLSIHPDNVREPAE
ncbi:LacI family DNA-binding transcriptional regulator [Tessaracoccus terricola]